MFKRDIERKFKAWKGSHIRKPLIVRGARQVGKTSAIRNFGINNFEQVIEINLEKKAQLDFFDGSKSVEDLLKRVTIFFNKNAEPGRTLLFIDEIQESGNIMNLLRFFAEEKPQLHIIAAGSLLEAKMDDSWTVPVGRIDYKYIYPMTFFEFLEACGKTRVLDILTSMKSGDKLEIKDLVTDLYKEYMIIGGMPEVVKSYIDSGSYDDVNTILNRLHTAYLDDIRKYSRSKSQSRYLEYVIEYGSRMAGSLFKYENFAGSNFKSREMSDAINTVEKVMLLKQVAAINTTDLPVAPKMKRPRKMIWLDIGLVNFLNNAFKEIIEGVYKGRIMEQIVGQSLVARGIQRKKDLYYWSKNKAEGSAEVDFCIQHGTRLVAIEVKSGNTSKMRSIFSMCDSGDDVLAVRVSWDRLGPEEYRFSGKKYKVLSIPFYLIDRLEEIVEDSK